MDPSKYGFGSVSWSLDMVNEMIRRKAGMYARPRTLRRILRCLGLSYFKPRLVPRKTAPAWEQDTFKEKTKGRFVSVHYGEWYSMYLLWLQTSSSPIIPATSSTHASRSTP